MKASLDLQKNLNAKDVVGSINLDMASPVNKQKVWIIVEGNDDLKLFRKLIDGSSSNVSIEESYGGKTELIKIVSEFIDKNDRVIGIRDADFIHFDGNNESTNNIFLTDYHDAEMMMISCDNTFRSLLAEFTQNEGLELRDKILNSIMFVAGTRWINESEGLSIRFEGLGFSNFFKINDKITLDNSTFIVTLMKRSINKKRSVSVDEINKKISNVTDFYNFCNGHDFQKVFALYVSSKKTGKTINEDSVSRSFRLAYSFSDFAKTHLYKQLQQWGIDNKKQLFKIQDTC
jgi:hypothetical protein